MSEGGKLAGESGAHIAESKEWRGTRKTPPLECAGRCPARRTFRRAAQYCPSAGLRLARAVVPLYAHWRACPRSCAGRRCTGGSRPRCPSRRSGPCSRRRTRGASSCRSGCRWRRRRSCRSRRQRRAGSKGRRGTCASRAAPCPTRAHSSGRNSRSSPSSSPSWARRRPARPARAREPRLRAWTCRSRTSLQER